MTAKNKTERVLGHNTLIISLRDHSWVSISLGDQEIASNHTPVPGFRFLVSPGTYTVRSNGVIEQVSSEFTSDAPDQYIVDGVGEIPADGTSFCTITIEAVTLDGTPLIGQAQEGEVFLRTTDGVLLDAAGENRIRSVTLKAGRAAFRLVAEASPRVVTVMAFDQGQALLQAEIQIEFV